MELSRQEYWGGSPFPPLGDLPDPGIELMSPVSPALQAIPYRLSHQRGSNTPGGPAKQQRVVGFHEPLVARMEMGAESTSVSWSPRRKRALPLRAGGL